MQRPPQPSVLLVGANPGEWPPGPGAALADRATARRAALDAVATIRTIESEEDGTPDLPYE
jgi:hypothetical protein